MSITKRIKAAWAALTQPVNTFQCGSCLRETLIVGPHPPDFAGLLCQVCSGAEFEVWLEEFRKRDEIQHKGAA